MNRRLQLEAQLSASLCALVEQGGGIALVDAITALENRSESIVFRPFEPAIEMDFSLLLPPQSRPSLFQDCFVEHLRVFVAQEVPAHHRPIR